METPNDPAADPPPGTTPTTDTDAGPSPASTAGASGAGAGAAAGAGAGTGDTATLDAATTETPATALPEWYTRAYDDDPGARARSPSVDPKHRPMLDEFMGRVTADQRVALAATGLLPDEALFYRMLRASDFRVDMCVDAFAATLKWRVDNDVLNIRPDELEAEMESGKLVLRGHDRFGRPILYMRPRLENTFDHEGNIRNLVFALESAVRFMPPGVEKWVVVIDYNGYSLRNAPPWKTTRETLDIFQSHYPERLGAALLVDAPWLFNGVWSMLGPFMSTITREKVRFVKGSNEPGMPKHDAFTQLFDLSQLHTDFGGTDDYTYDRAEYVKTLPPAAPVVWPVLEDETRGSPETGSTSPSAKWPVVTPIVVPKVDSGDGGVADAST